MGRVEQLLAAWEDDESSVQAELIELLYPQLRRIAASHLASERRGHTLQPTALVHEAYLKLVDASVEWQDRVHFLALASRVMRRILVDHAKARRRLKRGGGALRITLRDDLAENRETPVDFLALEEALLRLGARDPRKARIAELCLIGGMTYDEAAVALEISVATVNRELRFARAWLAREVFGESDGG